MLLTQRFFPVLLVLLALGLSVPLAGAADEPAWQPLASDFFKGEKPGYGGLCGVMVDHQSGNVYVNVSDKGVYLSTDQGKTFKRQGTQAIKGRTEWPGCFMIDPTGKSKRIVMALVYGSPIVSSGDDGVTWKVMDGKSGHVDWFAVDWNDPDLGFVLALKHEQSDLMIVSHDGGKTFAEIGKGRGPAWIFDKDTAVIAEVKSKDTPKPGFQRTTDGCKTFKPTATDFVAGKALPKWHDGVLYWLVDGAIISTADRGETWKKVCDLK